MKLVFGSFSNNASNEIYDESAYEQKHDSSNTKYNS